MTRAEEKKRRDKAKSILDSSAEGDYNILNIDGLPFDELSYIEMQAKSFKRSFDNLLSEISVFEELSEYHLQKYFEYNERRSSNYIAAAELTLTIHKLRDRYRKVKSKKNSKS